MSEGVDSAGGKTMLYTVMDTQKIWTAAQQETLPAMHRVQWNGTDLMVCGDGRVDHVLSSDPAVFLQLHTLYPTGRIH